MLKYVTGDATQPIGEGRKLIVHVCNNGGGWGRGFVLALSRRWRQPEEAYRTLTARDLGSVTFVGVEHDTVVANMVAQHGTSWIGDTPPIRYDALKTCLNTVANFVNGSTRHGKYSIHMPRIGCGLAGGSWATVEGLIISELNGLDVYVYDLSSSPKNWNE